MTMRFCLSAFLVMLAVELSGCSSEPVEEVDPFQTRGRSGSGAPAGPTVIFAPNATTDSTAPTASPGAIPGRPTGKKVAKQTQDSDRPPTEFEVVGEEIVIDPDSHRGRAKKLRERTEKAEKEAAEGSGTKPKGDGS